MRKQVVFPTPDLPRIDMKIALMSIDSVLNLDFDDDIV